MFFKNSLLIIGYMVDIENVVDRETIISVSENARIKLSDDEIEKFKGDFIEALGSFRSLDGINTEGIDPAFHPIELDDRRREDEVKESFSLDKVFSNTDNREGDHFKGPRAT